jgi:hypothetical protein
LTRIESSAFAWSRLKSIMVPNIIAILGLSYFSDYESRWSISFESNSRLLREFGKFIPFFEKGVLITVVGHKFIRNFSDSHIKIAWMRRSCFSDCQFYLNQDHE